MCSRFDLDIDIRAFQVQLGLEIENITHMRRPGDNNDDNNAPKGTDSDGDGEDNIDNAGNIDQEAAFDSLTGTRRPTDPVAVILPRRKAGIRYWGLTIPGRSTPLINARAETLAQKSTFRPLLNRRCLIPANGWYEWRKDGKVKFKNRITLPDHQPFLFAGLENGREVTIITCAPSGSIAHIHNRMPAVIGPNHLMDWLAPELDYSKIAHMLGPLPDHVLSWHEERPDRNGCAQACHQINLFSK